jgi:hypothetical protein
VFLLQARLEGQPEAFLAQKMVEQCPHRYNMALAEFLSSWEDARPMNASLRSFVHVLYVLFQQQTVDGVLPSPFDIDPYE